MAGADATVHAIPSRAEGTGRPVGANAGQAARHDLESKVSLPGGDGQPRCAAGRSNRSRFITLVHAATKSATNFAFPSALA